MANVSVNTLREMATRMQEEGYQGECKDIDDAKMTLADLRAEWELKVAPKLRNAAALFVMGLGVESQPVELERQMLEESGLIPSEPGSGVRFTKGGFDAWLFDNWALRERGKATSSLYNIINHKEIDRNWIELQNRGRALHTLLTPIESEYITTSFLERAGFAGSWVMNHVR